MGFPKERVNSNIALNYYGSIVNYVETSMREEGRWDLDEHCLHLLLFTCLYSPPRNSTDEGTGGHGFSQNSCNAITLFSNHFE